MSRMYGKKDPFAPVPDIIWVFGGFIIWCLRTIYRIFDTVAEIGIQQQLQKEQEEVANKET